MTRMPLLLLLLLPRRSSSPPVRSGVRRHCCPISGLCSVPKHRREGLKGREGGGDKVSIKTCKLLRLRSWDTKLVVVLLCPVA